MKNNVSSAMAQMGKIKNLKIKYNGTVFKAFNECRKTHPGYKRMEIYKIIAKQADMSPRTIRRIITAKKSLLVQSNFPPAGYYLSK